MKESRRMAGDGGQIAPMTVILVVALLALAGLVVDGGRLLATRRDANAIAAGAARAGTQAVDSEALRAGSSRLDRVRAASNARAYLEATQTIGTVLVTDQEVTVTVTLTAHPVLLTIVGLGDRSVTGSGSARIVRGL